MPFIRKSLRRDSQGFGADLRELRQLRGYTREALAKLTGIHTSVIAALEEERLQDMTDPEYAERHVRALATALDGSPQFFLDKYREVLQRHGLRQENKKVMRRRLSRRELMVSSRLMLFGAFVILVAALGGYVFWQAKQMTAPPPLSVDEPREGMQLQTSHLQVSGHTDPTAHLSVNGVAIIVGQDGSYDTAIDVPQGLSVVSIEAQRRYSPIVNMERHVLFERSPELEDVTVPGATSTSSTPPTN